MVRTGRATCREQHSPRIDRVRDLCSAHIKVDGDEWLALRKFLHAYTAHTELLLCLHEWKTN